MSSLTNFRLDSQKLVDGVMLFPIEVDRAQTAFHYSQDSPGGQVGPLQRTFLHFAFLGAFSLFILIQEFIDNVSDGEEAKPNDDEIILKLDDNKAASDLLGDDTQTESTNLLAGLDTQVDNQIDLLSLQKDTQNRNLVDFSTVFVVLIFIV